MSKGLILIPLRDKESFPIVKKYLAFLNLLDYRIGYTKTWDVSKVEENIILVFRTPRADEIHLYKGLINLSKDKKLILYMIDLHGCNRPGDVEFVKKLKKLMDRADVILNPHDFAFTKIFPDYIDKYVNCPQFASSEYYSKLELNKEPIMKCLFTGRYNQRLYPIRKYIYKHKTENIVVLPHSGWRTDNPGSTVGFKYAQELNKYFCSVTTATIMDFVVGKYFEIMASGSLLLATYTPDLDFFCIKNKVHYIQITKNNFFETLDTVLKNPERYEDIRREGRRFVLENSTEKNNLKIFNKMMETL